MRFSVFIFSGLFIMAINASSETDKIIFKDKKIGWTSKISGNLSNGCRDQNEVWVEEKCSKKTASEGNSQIIVEDSNAALACQKIGARLPTLVEFQSLIEKFDHIVNETENRGSEKGPSLTLKGIQEMNSVFGDMKNNILWTSTMYKDSNAYVYYFETRAGYIGRRERLDFDGTARCVFDLTN